MTTQPNLFDIPTLPYGGNVPAAPTATSRQAARELTPKIGNWQRKLRVSHGGASVISAACIYCGAIGPAYEGARRVACACNQAPSLPRRPLALQRTTKQLVNANGTAAGTTPRKNGAAQVD